MKNEFKGKNGSRIRAVLTMWSQNGCGLNSCVKTTPTQVGARLLYCTVDSAVQAVHGIHIKIVLIAAQSLHLILKPWMLDIIYRDSSHTCGHIHSNQPQKNNTHQSGSVITKMVISHLQMCCGGLLPYLGIYTLSHFSSQM